MKSLKTKYFELYLAGKNGYSQWFKTNKRVSLNTHAVRMLVESKFVPFADIQDAIDGAGYFKRSSIKQVMDAGFKPEELPSI